MKKIAQYSVHFSLLMAIGQLSYADECDLSRSLYTQKEFQKIVTEVKVETSSDCVKNILGLSHFDLGQRAIGLKILSELAEKQYPPAIFNLANMVDQNIYDARQTLILYKEALSSARYGREYRQVFLKSWESGLFLIRSCAAKPDRYCSPLNDDREVLEDFYHIGSEFLAHLKSEHTSDAMHRKGVEEAIVGVLTLGAALSVRSTTRSAFRPPTSPPSAIGTEKIGGMDKKTYLCVIGHISSGATRSVCN